MEGTDPAVPDQRAEWLPMVPADGMPSSSFYRAVSSSALANVLRKLRWLHRIRCRCCPLWGTKRTPEGMRRNIHHYPAARDNPAPVSDVSLELTNSADPALVDAVIRSLRCQCRRHFRRREPYLPYHGVHRHPEVHNGLMAIIQGSAKLDPYSDCLFLFCGTPGGQVEALHYEGRLLSPVQEAWQVQKLHFQSPDRHRK